MNPRNQPEAGQSVRLRLAEVCVHRGVSAHGVLFPAERPDGGTAFGGRENAHRGDQGIRLAPFAVSVRFQFVVIVCLLRFPAVVPVASSVRGSVPVLLLGAAFRQPFDRVQVSENPFGLSFRSGAAERRSCLPSGFFRLRPALSGSRRDQVQFGRPAFRRPFFRFTTRSGPPVPLVCCSSGSWSVSRFVLCSVQLALFRSFRLVLFIHVCPVRFSVSSIRFVLSSFYALCPLTGDFIYIILAYIIHD